MRLWRISRFTDPRPTFDGEGARQYPGRWNPLGVPVVYTSSSLSLATLEVLVHAELRQLKLRHYAFHVDVPDELIERPAETSLPADWRDLARPANARAFGADWATSLRSVALLAPSIVIPTERNAILNPRHPDFAGLTITGPLPFAFDLRMVKSEPRKK